MHHQLPAEFDADVEHVVGVQAVRNAVQDTHCLLLGFGTAVLVVGFLEGGELVGCFNYGVYCVFFLELLASVGYQCFEDVQSYLTGV